MSGDSDDFITGSDGIRGLDIPNIYGNPVRAWLLGRVALTGEIYEIEYIVEKRPGRQGDRYWCRKRDGTSNSAFVC